MSPYWGYKTRDRNSDNPIGGPRSLHLRRQTLSSGVGPGRRLVVGGDGLAIGRDDLSRTAGPPNPTWPAIPNDRSPGSRFSAYSRANWPCHSPHRVRKSGPELPDVSDAAARAAPTWRRRRTTRTCNDAAEKLGIALTRCSTNLDVRQDDLLEQIDQLNHTAALRSHCRRQLCGLAHPVATAESRPGRRGRHAA